MKNIFKACKDASKEYNTTIQGGANIAGFLKVSFAPELLCTTEPRLSVAELVLCCPGLDSMDQLQLCAQCWTPCCSAPWKSAGSSNLATWCTQAPLQLLGSCKLSAADACSSHAHVVVLQVADAMKAQGHV